MVVEAMKARYKLLCLGILAILLAIISCSSEPANGRVSGIVIIPIAVDPRKASEHAKVFVYVRDYTSIKVEERELQQGPIVAVQDYLVGQLESNELSFEFPQLKPGTYQISVLIDLGRPHVSPGSQTFVAYPGDYSGWTKPNIRVVAGETKEVKIDYGIYITIPEGYQSPLYLE